MNGARAGARLFVALALGAELGTRVAAQVARVLPPRAFRRPDDSGLHLTLAFLGDVEREDLAPLSAALRAPLAGLAAPALRLGGTGAFPSLVHARVLWVGVEERAVEERALPGRLAACRAAVLAGLTRAGIGHGWKKGVGEEHAAFTPHVSVARPRARVCVPPEFVALRFGLDWDPRRGRAVRVAARAGGQPVRGPGALAFPRRAVKPRHAARVFGLVLSLPCALA